jgi:hypothetical protein
MQPIAYKLAYGACNNKANAMNMPRYSLLLLSCFTVVFRLLQVT